MHWPAVTLDAAAACACACGMEVGAYARHLMGTEPHGLWGGLAWLRWPWAGRGWVWGRGARGQGGGAS